MIKELIKQADPEQYSRYFEQNSVKPYCFSVYLPNPKFTGSGFKIDESRLDVTFSSAQWDDIAWLHNGLLKVLESTHSDICYKNNSLKVGNISLEKEHKIISTTARFKTLSPIVLRGTSKESKHKDLQIRLFEDGLDQFNKELNTNMSPLIKQFLGRKVEFYFKPVEGKFKETIMKVQDDGEKAGVLFGHKGQFDLQGDVDVLNLLAQTGIGSRRGYGLGCLEFIE